MAHIESSWAEPEGFSVYGEIAGDAGLLTYDSADSTAIDVALRHPPESEPGVNVPTTYTVENPWIMQLEHFARCIQGLEEPIVTAEDAMYAQHVCLAALESATKRQTVHFEGGAVQ